MSGDFHQLIDAAIGHLHALRNNGARFVPVQPETFVALNAPVARRAFAPTETHPAREETLEPITRPDNTRQAAPAPAVDGFLSNTTKTEAIAQLRDRALQCVKCPNLTSTRTNVVFGVGNLDAEVMFVGEAPGADEDAQGEPFVGAAGQLLTRMISAMGLSREKVYIANILKCRPDMPAGVSGNRKPTPEEMQTCIPYLHAQIDLIQPKVLVALGGTAMEGLLRKTGITKLRGVWHSYRNIPLMPTYHPSYLLRNQSNVEKRKVWEDLLAVMERVELPITDKQRGYFLKA
jgi:DNA polymerase